MTQKFKVGDTVRWMLPFSYNSWGFMERGDYGSVTHASDASCEVKWWRTGCETVHTQGDSMRHLRLAEKVDGESD